MTNVNGDRPRCVATTTTGAPCALAARPGADTCGWHDPARGARVATAPRTCRRCGQTQPADHFSASGHGNGRRRVCIRCVRAAEAAKASRRRHPRVNARGEVWCNACQRYLPRDHFKPHPSRPGALWPYCTPCVRIKDRARYHKTKFRPDKAANAEERTRRKAARRAVEHRESPPRGRRTPHPAFAAVLAATATLREDYPVRDRWTGGAT